VIDSDRFGGFLRNGGGDTPMITIEVDKKGIKRVLAVEGSVAESQDNSDLLRATALPRQLLHNSVVEAFNGFDDTTPELDEPSVWIPTDRDGELDVPRKITVKVNVLPRNANERIPDWFIAGCKQLFPDRTNKDGSVYPDWANADVEEMAVMLFHSRVSLFSRRERILDHYGWVGESDGTDILVAEPYAVDHEGLTKLSALCDQLGWTYKIKGISGHYPGSTIRIEIKPKGQGK
jgi:hypothetical protein